MNKHPNVIAQEAKDQLCLAMISKIERMICDPDPDKNYILEGFDVKQLNVIANFIRSFR